MVSRKLLTFGMVASGSFLIFALTIAILPGGNIYPIGKVITIFCMVYMAFRVSKMVREIKKGNFLTNKQGVIGVSLFAIIGVCSIFMGQGQKLGGTIFSQIFFGLGIGLTGIALFFLFASLGIWVKNQWLSTDK